ncbi:MAG: DUF459 domain-containing protein [Actinobacteria bacterium]|nr:DUF459 domain-containing protein [Actinomycetota bacterium]
MSDRPPSPLPRLPDEEPPTTEQVATTPAVEKPERARRTDPRLLRRQWSAGHALVICVVALAIGLLLNAPGVHKSAYNKPDGWQRDLALAFTGPLADLSHALLLDRPRIGVQALFGRSGADEIDTEIALPATPVSRNGKQTKKPTGSPKTPTAPRKVAFTPTKKLRLWVAGDSLVIAPGFAVVRAAGSSPVIESVGGVDGRVATGLTRPDVFNWFEHIRKQMKLLRPRAVVLGFGGNDDKAYMTGLPDDVTIDTFGGAAWRREYARRVGGMMDVISRAGGFVVWIGLPQTKSAEQTRRFDIVNAVAQKEAREREGRAAFIDTYTMFAGDDGGYTDYLADPNGALRKVRAGDGVHFEREGGDIIAREVLKALNRTYDLTSWRKKRSA